MEEEVYEPLESHVEESQNKFTPAAVEVKKEESIFKFKKGKRLVAGIEISDAKKWIMLLKKEYQGDTTFVHFCMYRDKEFDKVTGVHIFTGFMKGERFVVTRNRMLENKGFNDFNIISRLTAEMEKLAKEGYSKDEFQYTFGEPGNPSYFKDPEEEPEEDPNDPEADLKKAAALLGQKKLNLLKSTQDLINNIGGVKLPDQGGEPIVLENSEVETKQITENTAITLFKRKSK